MSYNMLFNFVLSPRGTGKSYETKEIILKNYLKPEEQFIYVRRYNNTELCTMLELDQRTRRKGGTKMRCEYCKCFLDKEDSIGNTCRECYENYYLENYKEYEEKE